MRVFITAVLLLFLIVIPSLPAQTLGDVSKPIIRSASEIDYPPFSIVDDDGRADGFSVELIRAALAAMGYEVTFRTGTWNDVRGRLERGEIDALPLVGRTPEREALFDFTVPYMTMHGAIVVRDGTSDIRSLADLSGRRVAVMKGDNAEEFLRREERGIEIVTTPTFLDAFHALAEGRCDAVVVQRLVAVRLLEEAKLKGLRIVDRPVMDFTQDFCFAVKEGDRHTLALLNEGLALVVADGTHRRLHAKWFAYLELPSDRPIVIGGDHNYPPFEFLDEKGRPAGFTVDLTRAIAREMNMDVRINLGSWAGIVEGLENENIDAIQGMFYTPERDLTLDFSPHYLAAHYVGVSRANDRLPPESLEELAGHSVAVQAGDAVLEAIAERRIDAKIFAVDSQEDVLRAVIEGRADLGVAVRLSAQYLIERNSWSGLQLGKHVLHTGEYCYAVLRGSDALLTQLSEGLRTLQHTEEYRRIYEKWLGVYQPGVSAGRILTHIALGAVPLLLITGAAVAWSWMLRRQVAARTAELRRSTELQRAMVECSPMALYTVDTDGKVLTWNASAERIFGWTEQETVGKRLPIVPEDKGEEFASLRRKITNGHSFTGKELMRLKKSGSLFPISLSAAPIFNDNGAIVAIMLMAEDITARLRAEDALARQHRLLEVVGETTRFGGWSVDLAANTVAWSDVVCDIHGMPRGYSPKVEEGINFYAPEWRERIKKVFSACAEKGITYDEDMEIITPSGARVWVRTAGEAITDEAGRIVQVHGSFQDITKQMASEDALRRSETRYRLLAENTLDVIWVMSTELAFTYVNSAIEQHTGYTPDEWIGSRLSDHCAAEHFSQIEALVRQEIAEGPENQGMVLETEILRKDGTAIPLEIHAKVVFDGDGAPLLIQGVSRDITARLRLESQFLQAQKMESVGRLAGGVAHDFNNLLMGIMNYTELCRDGVEPDHPIREWLDEITREAERSANLTRQLLAFARKQTIAPRVIDLNDAVENMLKMLRRLIGEDIDLLWRPTSKLMPVKIDPGQVDQILANLCVNARDAIDGVGKVTIETENAVIGEDYSAEQHYYVRPGRYVRLAVSDDGSGMDREALENIFEPFYTTKPAGEGTGLGLATVYGIVKQNEGFINVYSEPGKGTTFRIYLPCVKGEEPAREGGEEAKERAGGSETILLVEDEKSIRMTTALFLEKLGYAVLTVETPAEALQHAADHAGTIHLLITDVVMPGMSGRDLAEKLAADYPAMKCLFISGYTANVIAHRGILDADVEFLAKPFTRDEIARKVREVLG